MSERRTKSVSESRVEISQLMRPQHSNFSGNVHGGVLLSLMDEIAYLCASRYSESYCVTVSVNDVQFQSPVRVGDMLTLRAAVNAVGRSSMEIGIQIVAEDPRRPDSQRRTHRCFFTLVALDDGGRPTEVPRLVCETDQDREWKCEAELRRQLRERYRAELETGACRVDMST